MIKIIINFIYKKDEIYDRKRCLARIDIRLAALCLLRKRTLPCWGWIRGIWGWHLYLLGCALNVRIIHTQWCSHLYERLSTWRSFPIWDQGHMERYCLIWDWSSFSLHIWQKYVAIERIRCEQTLWHEYIRFQLVGKTLRPMDCWHLLLENLWLHQSQRFQRWPSDSFLRQNSIYHRFLKFITNLKLY